MTVTAVNDAPVLSGANNFTGITEDQTSSAGDLVSALTAGRVSDVDSGALSGIAITNFSNSNGSWQYSTDGGTSWNNVGAVSDTSALLLRSIDRVRFVPNGIAGTVAGVSFHAWDQSADSTGTKVDSSVNGGIKALSSATATSSISVSSVNDAPVLDNTRSMTLTTISEDNTNNRGDAVFSIIASAGGDRITDADGTLLESFAVTGLVSGNGVWQYSINGGTSWSNVGAVSDTSALLLRDTDRLRFMPDGANGTSASVNFRAWDQSGGSADTKVDASVNGGITAFSSAAGAASISVTSVNDAPTITNATTVTLTSTDENTTSSSTTVSSILTSASWADVDSGAVKGIAVTSLSGNGNWQYSTDGTTWTSFGSVSATNALLLTSTSQVRYLPAAANGETATFGFKAWDQTSDTASTNSTPSYATTASSAVYSTGTDTASIKVTVINGISPSSLSSVNSLYNPIPDSNGSIITSNSNNVAYSSLQPVYLISRTEQIYSEPEVITDLDSYIEKLINDLDRSANLHKLKFPSFSGAWI